MMTLITNNALTICITHHTHHHRFGVARQIRSFTFGLLLSLAKFSTLFGSFFPPSVVFGVQTDEEEAASTKTYYDHPYRAQSVITRSTFGLYRVCSRRRKSDPVSTDKQGIPGITQCNGDVDDYDGQRQ